MLALNRKPNSLNHWALFISLYKMHWLGWWLSDAIIMQPSPVRCCSIPRMQLLPSWVQLPAGQVFVPGRRKGEGAVERLYSGKECPSPPRLLSVPYCQTIAANQAGIVVFSYWSLCWRKAKEKGIWNES